MYRVFVFLACLWGAFGFATAADIIVGPEGDYRRVEQAVGQSSPGDKVILTAGMYNVTDLRLPHDLTIEGQGRVILSSKDRVQKGVLVPLPGTHIVIRNIEFEGAKSPDKNGAGIRFQGVSLEVHDSVFRDNENGILATGDPAGSLLVKNSRFEGNGHGDGYSHGIYQSHGAYFSVRDSVFVGTKIGHHLKTLAKSVYVNGNEFDDGEGQSSYVVDATSGGRVTISQNTILRRSSARQATLFNYSTARGGELDQVTIVNNRIITEKARTNILRNKEKATVRIEGNERREQGQGSFQQASLNPQAGPQSPKQASLDAVVPTPIKHPTGLLNTPSFAPAPEEAVARFKVRQVEEQGSPYVTFGQVFLPGDVRPDHTLDAVIGTHQIPAQLDVKATHNDGSVRHAVVTLRLPEKLKQNAQGYLRISDGRERRESSISFDAAANLMVNLSGAIGEDEKSYAFSVGAGRQEPDWLAGEYVREQQFVTSIGPLLNIRQDIRSYADGTSRLRLTIENHKTFSPLPRDLSYLVQLEHEGRVIHQKNISHHYRNSGWTTEVWLGARPKYDIIHDPALLIEAGAIPALDLDIRINAAAIPKLSDEVAPGDYGPLTPYMPTSGGRADIGPMTGWSAIWAIAQNQAAKRAMLQVADVGMTIPWHFEDDEAGAPIRADQRPRFWADARGSEAQAGKDRFPTTLFKSDTLNWVVDTAHKPSLAYTAYLVTGEAVYARALRYEAAYAMTGIWPKLRKQGVIISDAMQLRSVAWGLRSIGNAAWILPSQDPLKAYFVEALNKNLSDLHIRYIDQNLMQAAGETEGYFITDGGRDTSTIAPWQNDFMAIVLSQEAVRGRDMAKELAAWMVPYMTGRVLAPGANLNLAAPQRHVVINDGRRVSNWGDLFAASTVSYADDVYAGSAIGGYGMYLGALGALHWATGDARTLDAMGVLKRSAETQKISDPDNQLGVGWYPQFTTPDAGE